MKFIVNARLPRSLVRQLNARGHDAIHTRDLANGNRSTDAEICNVSLRQERILITKDSDLEYKRVGPGVESRRVRNWSRQRNWWNNWRWRKNSDTKQIEKSKTAKHNRRALLFFLCDH